MTELVIILAALAVFALAGWSFALVGYTRASLALANGISVLHKVDAIIDERIGKLYDRIEAARNRPMRPQQPPAQTPKPVIPPPDAGAALSKIFGGSPFVEEQPEAAESLPVVTI